MEGWCLVIHVTAFRRYIMAFSHVAQACRSLVQVGSSNKVGCAARPLGLDELPRIQSQAPIAEAASSSGGSSSSGGGGGGGGNSGGGGSLSSRLRCEMRWWRRRGQELPSVGQRMQPKQRRAHPSASSKHLLAYWDTEPLTCIAADKAVRWGRASACIPPRIF
jgi:hypothetical protein